jgi:hypothetical protein
LASLGVDALERWLLVVPELTKPLLPQILPVVGDYLTKLEDKPLQAVPEAVPRASSAAKLPPLSTKAPAKSTGPASPGSHKRETLSEVQHRIVRLLGRLGGDSALILRSEAEAGGLAMDTVRRLQFAVPFQGSAVPVFLGTRLLYVL